MKTKTSKKKTIGFGNNKKSEQRMFLIPVPNISESVYDPTLNVQVQICNSYRLNTLSETKITKYAQNTSKQNDKDTNFVLNVQQIEEVYLKIAQQDESDLDKANYTLQRLLEQL